MIEKIADQVVSPQLLAAVEAEVNQRPTHARTHKHTHTHKRAQQQADSNEDDSDKDDCGQGATNDEVHMIGSVVFRDVPLQR
jgi:hypothetical protein